MDILFMALLGVIALAVLDCTVGRWLLRFTTTFKQTVRPGELSSSGTLLVHFPGTLMDGEDGVNEILPSLLANAAELLTISYGNWRFLDDEVRRKAADAIGSPTASRTNITLIGTSMGGAVVASIVNTLVSEYGWSRSQFNAMLMVETPLDERSYKEPGKTQSKRLRWVPAGPLLSLLVAIPMSMFYVGPEVDNIEAELRSKVRYIQQEAIRRLSQVRFAAVCDQQRFLNNLHIEWMMQLKGIRVVYLVCERDNVTVEQPQAYSDIGFYLTLAVGTSFEWLGVDSTHCGYLERSKTWNEVFDVVLKKIAAGQPIGRTDLVLVW